ncbi:hypothetical protein TRFO_41788 [Tritrichomonas foetus]|uniref:Uncharacterized protein n=1 Tax=Tritrichomonas foetus TaxID=1144522 RepID=A0A1J4KZ25_9EUKA|nr:hypothetical protein TRFO_41788 [Tritrichomonas foetus]|eukprot:OHT16503.1 hypothetical protein TRFO_41788 [Tritrichomonas foetus]
MNLSIIYLFLTSTSFSPYFFGSRFSQQTFSTYSKINARNFFNHFLYEIDKKRSNSIFNECKFESFLGTSIVIDSTNLTNLVWSNFFDEKDTSNRSMLDKNNVRISEQTINKRIDFSKPMFTQNSQIIIQTCIFSNIQSNSNAAALFIKNDFAKVIIAKSFFIKCFSQKDQGVFFFDVMNIISIIDTKFEKNGFILMNNNSISHNQAVGKAISDSFFCSNGNINHCPYQNSCLNDQLEIQSRNSFYITKLNMSDGNSLYRGSLFVNNAQNGKLIYSLFHNITANNAIVFENINEMSIFNTKISLINLNSKSKESSIILFNNCFALINDLEILNDENKSKFYSILCSNSVVEIYSSETKITELHLLKCNLNHIAYLLDDITETHIVSEEEPLQLTQETNQSTSGEILDIFESTSMKDESPNQSNDFIDSFSFSQNEYFTQSSVFTQSNGFTQSSVFNPSNPFSPSKQFTQSNCFTPSKSFSPSFLFTSSNTFMPKSAKESRKNSSHIQTTISKELSFVISQTVSFSVEHTYVDSYTQSYLHFFTESWTASITVSAESKLVQVPVPVFSYTEIIYIFYHEILGKQKLENAAVIGIVCGSSLISVLIAGAIVFILRSHQEGESSTTLDFQESETYIIKEATRLHLDSDSSW